MDLVNEKPGTVDEVSRAGGNSTVYGSHWTVSISFASGVKIPLPADAQVPMVASSAAGVVVAVATMATASLSSASGVSGRR